MTHHSPISLNPIPIPIESEEFEAVAGWPFEDPYIVRLLNDDIPQRVQFNDCRLWVYRDPEERLVGFGSLDICDDCCDFTDGEEHPYIPLLAVNPTFSSKGYGTSIVRHLVDEASLYSDQGLCYGVLFLDVYTSNLKAINVYTRCGFVQLTPDPIPDAQERGMTYVIMAKRVSL